MNAITLHEEDLGFELLAPETYDSFLQTLLWWYKEESQNTDEPPNLYWVLYDEHRYSNMFFDAFVESLCWQKFRLGVGKEPNSGEFHAPDFDRAMEEMAACFEHYCPIMQKDVEKILNNLQFVYSLYNPYEGKGPMEANIEAYYRNLNIQEVW